MPFFLQMVGAGPTTALSLHLSAVLVQAQWPTINCHELYEHNLLKERIPVAGGHMQVPELPGLGIEMDEDAIEKYRVEKADHSLPRRMIKVNRASGLNVYFANTRQKWVFFGDGNLPVDDWGSSTDYIDDDGSADFDALFKRAEMEPVVTAS
jgi:hypothetical protein